jgi:radical SAM superfamily enzyme YgiQ (UPF0313 family)
LVQLAALTPEKHNLTLLDNPINVNFESSFDLIGISAVTPTAIKAYNIADNYRKSGKTVVLGGYHPSVLPEEAKQHADSVVIGEAEVTWPQLLKDLEGGNLKPYYEQQKPVNPEEISTPNRSAFKKMTLVAPVQANWGCPYGCEFCSVTCKKFGSKLRSRPISQVVEEIRSIPQKYLFFCDPSLTINPEYTKNLFRKLKDLNKKLLMCNGNINVLGKDDELLKLASEAGCLEWLVGFESISQESIDSIGKKTNVVSEYTAAVKKIHDYNMEVIGEFVFGFDHDTPEIFNKTYDAIIKMEVDNPALNILTPYPGTPLFNRLEKEGRILTKDWSKYNLWDVVFKPKNMTEYQLLDGTIKLYEDLYSTSNTLKRIIKSIRLGFYPFYTTSSQNIKFWLDIIKSKKSK